MTMNTALLSPDFESLRLGVVHATELVKATSIALIGLDRGHGTSTLVYGLAQAFAAAEQPIALVDAHFSRPRLHQLTGCAAIPGLSEALAGTNTDEAVARPANSNPLMRVTPTGAGGAKVTYSRARWQGVLANLQAGAEFILIDAGCIQEPTALAAAAAADAVALVVSANRSPYEAVDHALTRLRECGASPIGTILNQRRYSLPRFLYRFL